MLAMQGRSLIIEFIRIMNVFCYDFGRIYIIEMAQATLK